ncbi:MAG: DUF222 domain-containing protein, partial [Pseudomonadota bacterium]
MEQAIVNLLPETRRQALEDQIAELSGNLAAATYRLLVLLREFDEVDGWHGERIASLAHWLSWKVGTNLGAAREKVRTAKALKDLPLISQAFSEGRVSFSKVRAMTRVATPANEEFLLQIARHGTARHVEQLVRHYRKSQRAEALERDNQRQERRSLSVMVDEDGMVILRGRFTPEQGALIIQGLDKAMDDQLEASREHEGEPSASEPFTARRADALERMAVDFLHGSDGSSGGDRYLVHLTTDIDTLERDGSGAEAGLDEVGNVSAETSRRLSCDCSLVHEVIHADGEILNVGRKTRTIPPSIRRALQRRDKGCRFPGCSCTRHVEGHHI